MRQTIQFPTEFHEAVDQEAIRLAIRRRKELKGIERARAAARANGVELPHPGAEPAIRSVGQFETALVKCEGGDGRRGFVRRLGVASVALYPSMTVEFMRRLAVRFQAIAADEKCRGRQRMRAVVMCIYPLHVALRLLPRLQKMGDFAGLTHLELIIGEFLNTIGPEGFKALGGELEKILAHARSVEEELSVMEAIVKLVVQGLYTQVYSAQHRMDVKPEVQLTNPRFVEAEASVAETIRRLKVVKVVDELPAEN